ncbi:MAG: MFS transporter [Fimbriimonadaceae bacterium]
MERAGRGTTAAIIAAALGYFVDVYDLWLFSVLRVASLAGLGFTDPAQVKHLGEVLLNWQMGGFILGALFFGTLSDKKGRLTVLFGSILVYSAANLANGFVTSIPAYAACRFFAGVGLAGELGAGIALVSELVGKNHRGWATTLVATTGVAGSVAAAEFAVLLPWRTSYIVGGVMGLALLVLRLRVFESGMFERIREDESVRRGDFLGLLKTRERVGRYLATILAGGPVWLFAGLFMTFSPELQAGLGITDPLPAPKVIMVSAIGLVVGDVLFGALSQIWKSRRRSLFAALTLMSACMAAIFLVARTSEMFYWLMFVAGAGAGYWAVFVTTAGETFGTNLRGTVAITAPCFVRGLVIPMTLLRTAAAAPLGFVGATVAVSVLVVGLALWSVWRLPETYGKDLDYVEPSIA